MRGENVVLTKSMQFSVDLVAFTDQLYSIGQKIIANQLLRSGTSIGANIWEAQDSESRKDFVHKIKLAAKEASETQYWLELCKRSNKGDRSEQLIVQGPVMLAGKFPGSHIGEVLVITQSFPFFGLALFAKVTATAFFSL